MTGMDTADPRIGQGCTLVVLVTYKSRDVVQPLLGSIRDWLAQTPEGRLAVIDNSGCQQTIAVVREFTARNADHVHASVSTANLGFSPAVNLAVDEARQLWGRIQCVVLVNPDARIDATTLAELPEVLANPSIGIVAPLLLDTGGSRVDRGSARRYWNRRRLFAEVAGAPRIARFLGTAPRQIAIPDQVVPVDVDITSGALMAIRGELFGAGLDTRLPMYLEDQEICHRARTRGLRVVVMPDLRATHVGGDSRRKNPEAARQLRMMELAAAPAASLVDTGRRPFEQLRVVVALAAGARAGAAVLALLSAGTFSARTRNWSLAQLRLSRWFLLWAFRTTDPTEHTWSA